MDIWEGFDSDVADLMETCLDQGVFTLDHHKGIARQMAARSIEGLSEKQEKCLYSQMVPIISKELVSDVCPCCSEKLSLSEMWNVLCDLDGCDRCNYQRWVFDRAD